MVKYNLTIQLPFGQTATYSELSKYDVQFKIAEVLETHYPFLGHVHLSQNVISNLVSRPKVVYPSLQNLVKVSRADKDHVGQL